MEVLATIGSILLAIIVLLLMVTIHESGHYLAGVLLKFSITEFSVGFGPVVAIPKFWDKEAMARIRARRAAKKSENYVPEPPSVVNRDYLFRLQRKNKRGELISLRWFPLGGFCAFAGEDEDVVPKKASDDRDPFATAAQSAGTPAAESASETLPAAAAEGQAHVAEPAIVPFNAMPAWRRLIVQFAGAFFNILSAIFFSMLCIAILGYSVPTVQSKLETEPADAAYVSPFEAGDTIVAVDGTSVSILHAFEEIVDFSPGRYGSECTVTVERVVDGKTKRIDLPAQIVRYVMTDENNEPVLDKDNNPVYSYGFGIGVRYETRKYGFWGTVGNAFPYTFKLAWEVLKAFGGLFTGATRIADMGGTVTTITLIGSYTRSNFLYFWILLPLIAVNLGVFNLFPIPALDGARMVFTLIEMIFRKPVPRKIEAMIHSVGLILLLLLVVGLDVFHLVFA